MKLNPYLMFPGTCREALTFYKELLNGEIVLIQTMEDAPFETPDEHKQRIFNAHFRAGDLFFMASDDQPDNPVVQGGNFAMFVTFSESAEQERVFAGLSEGGKVQFPLEHGFGMLTDKFGIQWMLASQ
ncbi:MAG: VOC family protein [Acidobacteriota bacterium]